MRVQAGTVSASTQPDSLLPTDSAVSENSLDGFDAWDEDTQKQWKRFMRGSRSQEVCQIDIMPDGYHGYQTKTQSVVQQLKYLQHAVNLSLNFA